MNGIFIGFTPRHISRVRIPGRKPAQPVYSIPVGRRPFEFLFEPIYPEMHDLHWWIRDGGFAFREMEERDEFVTFDEHGPVLPQYGPVLSNTTFYPAGRWLPEYALYVENDWSHVVGLYDRDGEPQYTVQLLENSERTDEYHLTPAYYALLAETSPLFFICVGGFAWEMYARDDALIQRVTEHLHSTEDWHDRFRLQFGTLENRDAWYSWNP